MSNVGRHARASEVAITIQADAKTISVEVKDNGCGDDAAAFEAADSYGVLGMRGRARHLSGSIDISSQRGFGS